jgi:hypothetical protein
MYIQVKIDPAPDGWIVSLAGEDGQPLVDAAGLPYPDRVLGRASSGGREYPLPPDGLPAGLAQADLDGLLAALFEQAGAADSVARFGHYLFECLFGAQRWKALDQAAVNQPLEFALTYASSDAVLNRLPWESMCLKPPEMGVSWENFVAAQPDIVLTRRPGGTRGPAFPPLALNGAARVLFVVGSNLTDPAIRPGAEYMGLLRGLAAQGYFLNLRLLAEARVRDLETAVREFQPSVLHFTCHGAARMADGKAVIQLRADEAGGQVQEVSAAELVSILRAAGPLPPVVVLNACSTAAADQIEYGRPFAAELVESGIAAVVGMAGPAADLACRLFTREFYLALLQGGQIGAAAARGRRGAVAYGGYAPAATLHWAMPTLYLSEQAGPAAAVLQVNQSEAKRYEMARQFNGEPAYPAFCDRWDIFKMYNRLMNGGAAAGRSANPTALAIACLAKDSTDQANPGDKLGRSRTLNELAAQALRDGHIPILVSRPWLRKRVASKDPQDRWPEEYKEFLILLQKVVRQTRDILAEIEGLKNMADWKWTHLPHFLASYPDLPPQYPEMTADMAEFGVEFLEALTIGLTLDLLSFLDAATPGMVAAGQKNPRLLFLLDDAHQIPYSDEIRALLEKSGKAGFRSILAKDRIRIVVLYSTVPVAGQADMVEDLKEWANADDILLAELGYLHHPVDFSTPTPREDLYQEAALVYQQFLMNWKDGTTPRPLALRVPAPNREDLKVLQSLIRSVRGSPVRFGDAGVNDLIFSLALTAPQALRPADDETAISNLAALRKRGM